MFPKQLKDKLNSPLQGWKYSVGLRYFLFFLIAIVIYFSLVDRIITETFNIQPNTISQNDIKAPKQILNEVANTKAEEDAVASIHPVYTRMPMKNIELINNIFNELEKINADSQFTLDEKASIYKNFFTSEYEYFYDKLINNSTKDELFLLEMRKQLDNQKYRISEEVFFKFPRLSKEDILSMQPVANTIMNRLKSEDILNADNIRSQVAEMVNSSELSKQLTRELVQEIVRFAITPNLFLDEAATLQAKEEAKLNIQPIYFEKNDILVKEGQLVTQELYNLLNDHGMLKGKEDYWPEVGLAAMVLLIVLVFFMYVRQSDLPISTNNVQLIMLILIYILNTVGMKIVALGQNMDYPFIGYLAPVALGSMLIAILLDVRLAYFSSFLFAMMSSVIFNVEYPEHIFDFRYGFVAIIICFISIFTIYKASQRATILKSGILISIFSCIAILSIILINSNQYVASEIILSLSFAFGSGLLTAVLVIGLLPFFEVAFGILSPLKLVELSNPNHPLLRKLLTETPGSYHHSIMVGNLSETAAESIGANGLLCRVGSFYHDIGKTKRPSYFIENQVNIENPHDYIEPDLSKSIIIAHARDGVEMLNEYKMPKQICDIAEQHHGTTLLGFFYHKALKLQKESTAASTEPITENDYRYPGPKAQSKEAAIVGISDCVEAAVRSLRNPTMEQIDSMVDKIIKGRMDDEQFNECDLTLKELKTIGKTLKETLLGIFHSRIEYPELPNKNQEIGVKET